MRRSEKERQTIDTSNVDAVYLDSSFVAKCGMFFVAVTKGRVFATEKEITAFNKEWCQNIKTQMHYDKYYLTYGVTAALDMLCNKSREGAYVLTNEGVATMLSEVQRYARSQMDAKNFMLILDQMIKKEIANLKPAERQNVVDNLKYQIDQLYTPEETSSFSTSEHPSALATRMLVILCEIYEFETYKTDSTESQIGNLIRLINMREEKYSELVKDQTAVAKDSQKFLQVAKQIREDKIAAYRSIYEHMIAKMGDTEIKRTDV